MAAEDGEPRFLVRRDDVEHDAGLVADPLRELRAIGGAAAGFGRDRAGKRDIAASQLVGADRQRAKRPVHRFLRQGARLRQALAKAFSSTDGNGPMPRVVPSPVGDALRRFTGMGWHWLGGYARFREEAIYRVESGASV